MLSLGLHGEYGVSPVNHVSLVMAGGRNSTCQQRTRIADFAAEFRGENVASCEDLAQSPGVKTFDRVLPSVAGFPSSQRLLLSPHVQT